MNPRPLPEDYQFSQLKKCFLFLIAGKRRRSSLFQSLASLASVAFISAMGSATDVAEHRVSSSESESEDGDNFSNVKSPVTFDLSPDSGISTISDQTNMTFEYDDETVSKYGEKKDVDDVSMYFAVLTHSQTTNFRLFQTERLCRRHFQI